MVQSVLAVLGGFGVMTLVVVVSTIILARTLIPGGMMSTTGHPPIRYMIWNLGFGAVAAVLGGYLTATWAPANPLRHGIGLAVFMAVMSILSMRQAAGRQPRWYAWTLATVMPLLAIGGAYLKAGR